MGSIASNLQEVSGAHRPGLRSAGRDAQSVTLLAVSKTFGRGGARGPCRRPVRLRRKLRAGGAGQDRALADLRRSSVAPDRPAAEQQDAAGGRGLRLGAHGGPAEDRAAAGEQRPAGCRRCSCACRSTSAARPARAAWRRPRCRHWRAAVAALPRERVCLRGLMAIPEPAADPAAQRRRTGRCASCCDAEHPQGLALDT
jgi:hypothetical protein